MPSITHPMHLAIGRGCLECLKILLETPPYFSVDDCCGSDGLRPIHIAAKEGHIQVLRFLSSAGACIEHTDDNGFTALHHASISGQIRAVRWLLRHGAKISLDNQERSPITIANDHGHFEIADILNKHVSGETNGKIDRRLSVQGSGNYTTRSVGDYSDLNVHSAGHDQDQLNHQLREQEHTTKGASPESSSGNSSLVSTNAPSLSPSSSSAISCGCSTSDETAFAKSTTELSDTLTLVDYQASEESSFQSGTSLITSPTPFYLHPPDKEPPSPRIDFGTGLSSPNNKGILKKGTHKRQQSVFPSHSPFFLHPPENLISETQKVVNRKMPTVNSSHPHHHFADPCESSPKLKMGLIESSSSSSTSSPPHTPPGTKSGMSVTISECISKFQSESSSPEPSSYGSNLNPLQRQVETKVGMNQGNVQSNKIPPPPPPPPPPPAMTNPPPDFSKSQTTFAKTAESKSHVTRDNESENAYEDIYEVNEGKNQFEQARKLLRTVSAPPASRDSSHETGDDKNETYSKNNISPSKPPTGGGKLPFIPPHFPEPPQDALIKPSEYLRSIQNKSKPSAAAPPKSGQCNGSSVPQKPLSKIEEAIKALNVKVEVNTNGEGPMSPLPEETNVLDEFEEINLERINRCVKFEGVECDENNNSTKQPPDPVFPGGGEMRTMVKAEELRKVHLRKTPMTRTKSAPPLGRVIEDDPCDATKRGENLDTAHDDDDDESNGHDPIKRSNTLAGDIGIHEEVKNVSKADVIAELSQSSQVGGVREWKEELKRRQKEQEKIAQKEIEQYYQPVNFVSEVPSTDVTGVPIPDWKRQMMARKAAERARKEAEEQRRLEIEAKRQAAIPMWRRQLLQRRESDAKFAQ